MTEDGYPKIIMSGTDPNLPDAFTNGFSKYSSLRELAHGGKAQLYAAWDGILGRSVAIKTLLPKHAASEYERRRFLREARVTAQLQHPNTPPIYEIGRKDDGGLYFTMKLLAGQNLYSIVQRLQRRDAQTAAYFTAARLMEIVTETCQAFAYAHNHGVIHRDIKPENIWVGMFGEVLVLDWGVAKVWGQPDEPDENIQRLSDLQAEDLKSSALEPDKKTGTASKANDSAAKESAAGDSEEEHGLATDDHDDLQSLTQSGNRPGTPLYMSPEQVKGDAYVDERTDIFSIGVVMYELLTLKLPFYGRTIKQTFELIIGSDPKRPTYAAPFREIPDSIEAIVMKALQKKPGDRFQSMDELLDALFKARQDLKH